MVSRIDIDDIFVEKKLQVGLRVNSLSCTIEILMQKCASVWKNISKIDLILAAELLKTLSAGTFIDHLGDYVVEDHLLKLL